MADGDFLKVKASDPRLEKKIHINVTDPREKIYWYIKFNLMLDETSVTNETMFVTDREGFVLQTDISYRVAKNLIVISPLEDYAEGVYYILNITKGVRSAKLNSLKNDIHILFKIKENRVEDFVILPPNVVVPEPKIRVRKSEKAVTKENKHKESSIKLYSFDKNMESPVGGDSLPVAEIRFNPIIGIIGIILTFASLFLGNNIIMAVCGAVALTGLGHIVYQLTRGEVRSDFAYNKGVRLFKRDKFLRAEEYFNKALKINPQNEYAEYAKGKISYYKE